MNTENNEDRLDNPLVVHKESDTSYQVHSSDNEMSATHTEDEVDAPTLERHRFKREKKTSKSPYFIITGIVVIIAVLLGIYFTGTYDFGIGRENGDKTSQTRKSYTTMPQNDFEGIITIKGTYIFFEGEEVGGIEELDKKIKYLDEGSSFVVQDEKANNDFLNLEVLPLLMQYNIDYSVTHIVSSGLESKYETTQATTTTTTTKPTSAATTQ